MSYAASFLSVNTELGLKYKKKHGFAKLSPKRRQDMARLGGQTAHVMGRAHEFTKAEAKAAAYLSIKSRRAKNRA